MDFIRVTLVEKYEGKGSISNRKERPDYYLPVAAIKSISPDITGNADSYIIDILDNYVRTGENFTVGSAKVKLANGFIRSVCKLSMEIFSIEYSNSFSNFLTCQTLRPSNALSTAVPFISIMESHF